MASAAVQAEADRAKAQRETASKDAKDKEAKDRAARETEAAARDVATGPVVLTVRLVGRASKVYYVIGEVNAPACSPSPAGRPSWTGCSRPAT